MRFKDSFEYFVYILTILVLGWILVFTIGGLWKTAHAAQGTGRRPNTINLSLASSATEYSQALGSTYKPVTQLQIKCRTANDLYLSFEEGGTSDTYTTIESGSVYFENELQFKGTVYLKGDADSLTAELLYWD